MTAHHRAHPVPLDPARAIAVQTMISHISALLDPGSAHSGTVAGRLLAQIDAAYPGAVQTRDQHLTLALYAITASAEANTIALLRNWQAAARIKLETGAR